MKGNGEKISMITAYDYGIIGFYLLFMLAIGVVFRRMSKDTSDYFRAGGAMPWWLTGVSAWIFTFSANNIAAASQRVKGVVLNPCPSLIRLNTAYLTA